MNDFTELQTLKIQNQQDQFRAQLDASKSRTRGLETQGLCPVK